MYESMPQELALLEQVEQFEESTKVIEREGLKHIAGYVSYRFQDKYPTLSARSERDLLFYLLNGLIVYLEEN